MIQDDPINQKSKKTGNSTYLPLNNDSEEDLVTFNGIEVALESKKSETEYNRLNNSNTNNINANADSESEKNLYFKFALLIGLCKY